MVTPDCSSMSLFCAKESQEEWSSYPKGTFLVESSGCVESDEKGNNTLLSEHPVYLTTIFRCAQQFDPQLLLSNRLRSVLGDGRNA